MHLPLTLIFRLTDYWEQLTQGARDNIVGGLVILVVGGIAGTFIAFGKRILRANASSVGSEPAPVNRQQEVKLKIEVTPTPPPLPPVTHEPTQTPRMLSTIPRPPAFGFVARRDQQGRDIVERLKQELSPDKEQLIVLWGAGGVGKTTLAAETARTLRKVFEGGIAWISAEGRPDFGLSALLDGIARHLRRPDLRQLALEVKDEQVHQALTDAPTPLIILDNFETILPEEQERCATWLAKRATCPVLITSRDEVGHARPIHILAMSLPEAHEFLQKLIAEARNTQAFLGLEQDQIIQAADRIPLVLQWLVKQIDSAKQPQTVLADLSTGKGDAAQRVFDRSFELSQLGDDGRVALLALTLFVPNASREALAEVAGFDAGPDRLNDAVQALDELWLIKTTEGNDRLSVEGLTRELAKARLAKDERGAKLRERFVAYFLRCAEEHAQPTPEDYEALEKEKDNLLHAMDVAFEIEHLEELKIIGFILTRPANGMLNIHGYWDEAIQRGKQALEAAKVTKDEYNIGAFAHGIGSTLAQQGNYPLAKDYYELSVNMARRIGAKQGLCATLHEQGSLAQASGNIDEARRLYNESLTISKELDSKSEIAKTLHQLATLAKDRLEIDEARRLYNESREIKTQLGDQNGIAKALSGLGELALAQGELDEARQLYNQSLEINLGLGNQHSIAICLHQLGRVLEEEGDTSEAASHFRKSLTILERLRSKNAEIGRRSLARVEGKSS